MPQANSEGVDDGRIPVHINAGSPAKADEKR
jgi:hypothetical protein